MRPLVLVCDDDKLACQDIATELGERDLATAMDTSGLGYEMTRMLKPATVVLASGGAHQLWMLRRLKNDPATAAIPVVLYAAGDSPEAELEARRLGVRAYLRKPNARMPEVVAEMAKQFAATAPSGPRLKPSR